MEFKKCPIETAVGYIGKKWSVNIIRDIFFGKKRFREFLESNKELSTKMLSERLRELEKDGIIFKDIKSKTPLIIGYALTDKGKFLNKIIFEMAMFSMKHCQNEVFNNKTSYPQSVKEIKKLLGIH
ncbi:MAG TPA: helix-turn-helix domain-containing protein [Candidatus Nanoarchaeia archaeon]|nr:helix-turn-helix domain-containing protein [Candidatus Nanoarchaeia archaeon]